MGHGKIGWKTTKSVWEKDIEKNLQSKEKKRKRIWNKEQWRIGRPELELKKSEIELDKACMKIRKTN